MKIRGSVVSLSFFFLHPPEDKKKQKKRCLEDGAPCTQIFGNRSVFRMIIIAVYLGHYGIFVRDSSSFNFLQSVSGRGLDLPN